MLVTNHRTRHPQRRVATTRATSQSGVPNLDQVTLGSQPKHKTKTSKVKAAVIAGAAGAVVGAIGGAIGGPVGGIAAAPVVGLIGGVAAASAFKFSSEESEEKVSAEKRKLLLRTATAGLVGAAVVGLGVAGGMVGAVAAGVGGLATGAAMGYGLGS